MQNVLERMEAIGAERKMADFNVKMKMDYEFKKNLSLIHILRQSGRFPVRRRGHESEKDTSYAVCPVSRRKQGALEGNGKGACGGWGTSACG